MELILGGSGKDKDNNYLLNKTTIKANSLFKKKLSHIYPDQVKYTVVENPTVNAFINIYSDVEIDEYIDEDLVMRHKTMRHITIYECFDTLQITKNPTENTITVEEADELNSI